MTILYLHLPTGLKERDNQLLQIENLIESKRRMLLEKQKKMQNIAKQNHFLDEIKNDYTNYYNYIAQQKQDQIKALELLNGYIHDLTRSGQLSTHNIEDAKSEQRKILKEVRAIQKGLDSIMEDTKYIEAKV